MRFRELKKFEPNLELIYPEGKDDILEIFGLTDFFALESGNVLFVRNQKYLQKAMKAKASNLGVILSQKLFGELKSSEFEELKEMFSFLGKVEDVDVAMSRLSYPYYLEKSKDWNDNVDSRQLGTADIHPSAYISQNVFIGKGVKIGANTKIHSGVVILSHGEIGQNCEIFPNVSLYHNVKIGNHVRLHSGTVIGADGFGYNFHQGEHLKVWHMGGAIIQDYVEIGSNSCVDQGTFSPTLIGEGAKIDNHVQVGHNSQIGKGVILCGQVGISGSTIIGDFTIFGGRAATVGNCTIGKNCQIAGDAVVNTDWGDNVTLGGHPARPLREWLKGLAYLRKVSLES